MAEETEVLIFKCDDRKGIIARVSNCIFQNGGNITKMDQYSSDAAGGEFFLRAEFVYDSLDSKVARLKGELDEVAKSFQAQLLVVPQNKVMRMGILVSRPDHCLAELLYRWRSGELVLEIPLIVSNCRDHAEMAAQHGIPYHYMPVTKDDKKEEEILELLADTTDFLVLARYMQILSKKFLAGYGRDIINIHHSFLPSFVGSNPYRQAYERGVKLIGATAHYVTEDLDEGPIIEQTVARVTHKDDVASLRRKGKNLEKMTLSQAVLDHIDHRVIRNGRKTIVFN